MASLLIVATVRFDGSVFQSHHGSLLNLVRKVFLFIFETLLDGQTSLSLSLLLG